MMTINPRMSRLGWRIRAHFRQYPATLVLVGAVAVVLWWYPLAVGFVTAIAVMGTGLVHLKGAERSASGRAFWKGAAIFFSGASLFVVLMATQSSAWYRWKAVRSSSDPAVLRAYLENFPQSPHVVEARTRYDILVNDGAAHRSRLSKILESPSSVGVGFEMLRTVLRYDQDGGIGQGELALVVRRNTWPEGRDYEWLGKSVGLVIERETRSFAKLLALDLVIAADRLFDRPAVVFTFSGARVGQWREERLLGRTVQGMAVEIAMEFYPSGAAHASESRPFRIVPDDRVTDIAGSIERKLAIEVRQLLNVQDLELANTQMEPTRR